MFDFLKTNEGETSLLDISWFQKSKIKKIKSAKNLFIISTLGQLNQVEKLIKYENLDDCILVILYTNQTLRMPKLLQKKSNKKIFSKIILFLLPMAPNSNELKKLFRMKKDYHALIDMVKPINLYLLSFESHYTLIATYAKRKNINLILLDDGVGTYKNKSVEKDDGRKFSEKIIAKCLGVNTAFKWHLDFKKVYATFPALLKETFQAEEYHQFFAHASLGVTDQNIINLVNKYHVTKNDYIYINQRYAIDDADLIETTLLILNELSFEFDSNIFIKLHPKDSVKIKNDFKKALKENNKIFLIEDNEFLIEPSLAYIQPKGIISLASTTLIYAPLVSSDIKVFSIKPWFTNIVPKFNNETGIQSLNEFYNILEKFDYVQSLESLKSLDSKNINMRQNFLNKNHENFLDIARKAYVKEKYQKVIINYMWAYSQSISHLPIDDFIKYLDAFWHEHGTHLSQDIMFRIDKEIQEGTRNISDYTLLINSLAKIVAKNYEYKETMHMKLVKNSLLALVTNTLGLSSYPIDFRELESLIENEYQINLLPLLMIKERSYILEFKYNEALTLLDGLFKYDEYIEKNQYLYIDRLKCLIGLGRESEVMLFLEEINSVKMKKELRYISEALVANYKNDFNRTLDILTSKINSFSIYDKGDLKPELIVSHAYRYLEDYQQSKSYLLRYESHSKGNLVCHRYIAYLEYKFKNYSRVVYQFNRAYPNGIDSMLINDFIKYIDAFQNENGADKSKKILKEWVKKL